MPRFLLEHSIVGQSLTSLTIRKDREFAGCRICGATFQSRIATDTPDASWCDIDEMTVAAETRQWRDRHSHTHSEKEHHLFKLSGLLFSPEAAHKLAPFGLASITDADEVNDAMLSAPRAPYDDVETTLKGYVTPNAIL